MSVLMALALGRARHAGLDGVPIGVASAARCSFGELSTPQNMMRWIEKPRNVELHTAMPDMGVTDNDACDITAYLFTALIAAPALRLSTIIPNNGSRQ